MFTQQLYGKILVPTVVESDDSLKEVYIALKNLNGWCVVMPFREKPIETIRRDCMCKERSALMFLVANLKITLDAKISSGNFGTVYKAQWQFALVAGQEITIFILFGSLH